MAVLYTHAFPPHRKYWTHYITHYNLSLVWLLSSVKKFVGLPPTVEGTPKFISSCDLQRHGYIMYEIPRTHPFFDSRAFIVLARCIILV